MEIYKSKDGTVIKYIHDNGAETAVKTTGGCNSIFDPDKDQFYTVSEPRDKFVVFISCSYGCQVNCKFCYLTTKKCKYHKLSYLEIFENTKEAIEHTVEDNPSLKGQYVKLSWMGMGDALYDTEMVHRITLDVLRWMTKKSYTIGIDGVDVATSYPKGSLQKLNMLERLDDDLSIEYDNKINPLIKDGRSVVRLFYSLHSFINNVRSGLIPGSTDVREAIADLVYITKNRYVDVIYHYMFLDGVNDFLSDLTLLETKFNNELKDNELRILRFNECPNGKFKESMKYKDIIKRLTRSIPNVKFQISTGSEIKSACGQFIIKQFK